jgi:acyl-CoA thioesterase FadM
VSPDSWIETYRGGVFRWEIDHVDHLTVAYYFERFEDASVALLEAIGLGGGGGEARAWITADCHVRYLREMRGGDVLHIVSGVIAVDETGLVVGHKLHDSASGTLCTTAQQRLVPVAPVDRAPVPLTPALREAAERRRVAWDGPPRERRPRPRDADGFRDTGRDVVKTRETSFLGQGALSAYIHRFSAASMQAHAALGLTPAYMRDEHRAFSSFELQLFVERPLRPGDLVAVQSVLLHVGTTSMHLYYRMLDARTGNQIATLDQLGVHLDMDARRPLPLPAAIREQALSLLVPAAPA